MHSKDLSSYLSWGCVGIFDQRQGRLWLMSTGEGTLKEIAGEIVSHR